MLLAASCGGKIEPTPDIEVSAVVPPPPPTIADASVPDAAVVDNCNTLVQQAPQVYETESLDPTPALTGGPLAEGMYILTSDLYLSPGTMVIATDDRVTLEIKGSTMNVVETTPAGEMRATFTFTSVYPDDLLQLTRGCVSGPYGAIFGGTRGFRYSATDTQITEFEGGRNLVPYARTYTKL